MADWKNLAARKREAGDEEGALYEEGFGAHEEGKRRDLEQCRAWLEGWDDAKAYGD